MLPHQIATASIRASSLQPTFRRLNPRDDFLKIGPNGESLQGASAIFFDLVDVAEPPFNSRPQHRDRLVGVALCQRQAFVGREVDIFVRLGHAAHQKADGEVAIASVVGNNFRYARASLGRTSVIVRREQHLCQILVAVAQHLSIEPLVGVICQHTLQVFNRLIEVRASLWPLRLRVMRQAEISEHHPQVTSIGGDVVVFADESFEQRRCLCPGFRGGGVVLRRTRMLPMLLYALASSCRYAGTLGKS